MSETKFADLVDRQPETFMCPRRDENPMSFSYPGPDHWNKFKSNGNRTCSYCGSLHPEDFFEIVKKSGECVEGYEIEPSDKGYKVYVRQPGVINAHHGGIKFYKQHLEDFTITEEHRVSYQVAIEEHRRQMNIRFGR